MSSITYDQVGQNMSSVGANAIQASTTRPTGSTVGIGGVAYSGSSGDFSVTTTPTAVGINCTITTSGRPVWIGLTADGSNSTNPSDPARLAVVSGVQFYIAIYRGGTNLGWNTFANTSDVTTLIPPSAISTIDFPSAGTYTYTVQVYTSNGSGTVGSCQLVAYEL
jgi:hypothetical protein